MVYVLIFSLGASLGSFYHVIGLRIPQGRNWMWERSACPACGQALGWRELLPIVSYLLQKGRCRTCNHGIAPLYFWTELLSGALFLLPAVQANSIGELFFSWVFLSLLILITVSDLYFRVILNKTLLFFLIILLFNPGRSISGMFFGFFVLLANFLLGKVIFKRETLGGGDIKLFGLIGLMVGRVPTLWVLLIASLSALVYSLIFLKDKKRELPFGPFIALAGYIVMMF